MRVLLALIALILPASAWAQTVVASDAPEQVAVTLYRAPNRAAGAEIPRGAPGGYALVSETRTIDIPAGVAVIRFEGVAGGILPDSALIAGLPGGVEEKNLDADLLSPRTLFDRALGRRVVIRRTDPATGKQVEQQAVIKSSSGGAAVLQIAGGYEGLRCSGLPEALVYDGVPDGLSAKPTLSVRTTSPVARRVTITLSYLAGGFDWAADYVVTMDKGGRGAELFAWITLASADPTSFVDAALQVVAGKLNRRDDTQSVEPSGGPLTLKCWPLPRYDFPENRYVEPPMMYDAAPPPPPVPAPMMAGRAEDIVVTGTTIAKQEDLGDLKLYRFPDRVTVASNGQKQVAMLDKHGVKLAPFYVGEVREDDVGDTQFVLRAKNRADAGLGAPLPAGRVAVFTDVDGRRLLVGRSKLDDKAVDENVELKLGETDQVKGDTDLLDTGAGWDRYRLTITNANPWPIDYEAAIIADDDGEKAIEQPSRRLGSKNGQPLWTIRVPANGTATLDYTVRKKKAVQAGT